PNVSPYDRLLAWWRDELSGLRSFVNGSYRTLPWQVVHRDLDPSNTLVESGQVTAILDFEFAGLDACVLDVAASLKFTMRVWGNPDPWEVARRFCRGYRYWNRLTQAEVESLHWLIRLRDAVSTVWRMGRTLAVGNVYPTLGRVEAIQASAQWLQKYGPRLVDVVGEEVI
ncbi:MAG: phosphotransferase, partial [Chloroflexota bacterium]|nr:phosphotransferase [Chloroflexota bacterium]